MVRLYCHRCGKVTEHIAASEKTLQCIKCDRQQPIKSLKNKDGTPVAVRKNPLTNPDGTKQTKRPSAKGGLTGSKRFEVPEVNTENPVQAIANVAANIGQKAAGTVETVSSTARSLDSGLKTARRAFSGGSALVTQNHTEALGKANEMASQYGLAPIDLGSLLGSDPYAADGSAPEMGAAEANQLKLRLQRQGNAIEVRHQKIQLGRKIVKMATEQVNLVGDFVDYATAGINTATKVVKNEIANTQFQTEQSKLEQAEELLVQQQVATEGTMHLTEGVREEWRLKLEKQQTRNSGLRIEIEGSIRENDRKLEELEARLLQA